MVNLKHVRNVTQCKVENIETLESKSTILQFAFSENLKLGHIVAYFNFKLLEIGLYEQYDAVYMSNMNQI